MNEKINIAELLKDCPKGMELDCTIYDKVTLIMVDDKKGILYPIKILREDGYSITLTKYGQYTDSEYAKCVIFPKGKTTWEGFQRPFKDGDIVVCVEDNEEGKEEITQMFILKSQINNNKGYCYTGYNFKCKDFFKEGNWYFDRLATEEEKQKLFDAIKANGYKWNAETKTLEKLIEPKFKVGDKVKNKDGYVIDIIGIDTNGKKYIYRSPIGAIGYLSFYNQNNYELAPNKFDITTLKPFDKVLVRDLNSLHFWEPKFFFRYEAGREYPYRMLNYQYFSMCIPYEGNEHLIGTTDECDDYFKTWK